MQQPPPPGTLPEAGAGGWSLALSPLVPFGDQVFDVGIQLVICIDVNVLKQSRAGLAGGHKVVGDLPPYPSVGPKESPPLPYPPAVTPVPY